MTDEAKDARVGERTGGSGEMGPAPEGTSVAPEPLSLRRNMLWNTVGSLTYLVCNWLTTVLVVVLGGGEAASGSLAVSMAVGNIMATIVLFRVRPVQVSDVRGAFGSGNFVALRIVSSAVAVVFCLVYGLATVAPENYLPALLYCAFKLVDSFVDVYHGIDQLNGRLDYTGVSQMLRGLLVLASFVVGMTVFGRLWVALALMVATSAAVVIAYDVPRSAQFASLAPAFAWGRLTSLIATCAPGFVSSLMVTMVVSLARQVFGMRHGDDLLGIYAAVATPTVVVQALASYLYAPLLGPIAEQWAQGRTREIARVVARVLAVVAVVCACGVVAGALFGEPVLSLVYGRAIGEHADLLSAMLVCTALSASMFFLVDMLVVFRDARGSICAAATSLLACLALMGPLLARPDMNAVSLLIIASYALGALVALLFISRDLRRGR